MKKMNIRHHHTILQADELSRAIYSSTILARKIIAFGASRIQEKLIDQKQDFSSVNFFVPAAEFRISELLDALGLSRSGENYFLMKKTIKEMKNLDIEIIDTENEYHAFNWFSSVHYNKNKDKIELVFTPEIGWTLYEWRKGYTTLNLNTVGEFKSFYAFRFYEIALSWQGMKGKNGNKKGQWWFQMTTDEIRRTFKIPDTAYTDRMSNFVKWVIQKPLDELNKINTEFTINITKVMRGRNLIAFRFDCFETSKETKKIAIKNNESKQITILKQKINKEEHIIEELLKIKNHQDFWKNVYDEALKNPIKCGNTEIYAKTKADIALLKEYGKEYGYEYQEE